MEPLTALSLAGNVIQFVDFGSKLLSRTGEVYRSSIGSLETNDEIELVTTDLRALVRKLRQSFIPWDNEKIPTQHDQDTLLSFRRVCDDAAKVAEELIGRLNKLDPNTEHRRLRSLQHAIKSLWSESEIASLIRRLSALRGTLESHVLVSIRESLTAESARTCTRFDTLDREAQQILITVLESTSNTEKKLSKEFRDGMDALAITISQLIGRLDLTTEDSGWRTRGKIVKRTCERQGIDNVKENLHYIVTGVEMLEVSEASDKRVRMKIHDHLTKSLKYDSMTNRYEDVNEAHPNTFEWAFKSSTDVQRPWSNLSDWLETGDGVYWVCGKAGSGKSTLMKCLYDDKRTKRLLTQWADNQPLCLATFFFWNSGSRQQKSQTGLLRSLLFQAVYKYPELAPLVFPKLWARAYSKAVGQDPTPDGLTDVWTLRTLMDAFSALVRQRVIPIKMCFLIDGLDEFDGDHEEMGMLFQQISTSKNVKVCLSSRPWVVFEQLFHTSPMLRLQHLTYDDIERYVADKLRANSAYQRLASRDPRLAERLLHEIVDKADGVFLWVKLVVQSLLNGIRNRDGISDLWERLRLMPRELEPLYGRLLELMEPIYLTWVSKVLQILQANRNLIRPPFVATSPSALTLSDFFFAMNDGVDVALLYGSARISKQSSFDEKVAVSKYMLHEFLPEIHTEEELWVFVDTANMILQDKCEDMWVQLTARCAGFVEVSSKEGNISPKSHIQYFHRSARDFLETEENWSKLLLHTNSTEFDPNIALMKVCIIKLQLEPILIEAQNPRTGEYHRGLIRGVATDLLVYAQHVDVHVQSQGTQKALLDQMSFVLSLHYSKAFMAEMKTGQSPKFPAGTVIDLVCRQHEFTTLLETATIYGLKSYVRGTLTGMETTQFHTSANSLLRLLLPRQDCFVFNGLPLPEVELVTILLNKGASPDASCDTMSAWKNMLTYHANSVHKSSCPSLQGDKYNPLILQRRYIEIMTVLALSGADPQARIVDYSGATLSVEEVIKDVLVPKFPSETEPLLQALQQKARADSGSKKRALEHDLEEAAEELLSQSNRRSRNSDQRSTIFMASATRDSPFSNSNVG